MYDLGLTPERFYNMLPWQFDALCRRKQDETWEREYAFGLLSALVVNTSLAAPKEPKTAEDYMLCEQRKKLRPQAALTPEQVADRVKWAIRFSGT